MYQVFCHSDANRARPPSPSHASMLAILEVCGWGHTGKTELGSLKSTSGVLSEYEFILWMGDAAYREEHLPSMYKASTGGESDPIGWCLKTGLIKQHRAMWISGIIVRVKTVTRAYFCQRGGLHSVGIYTTNLATPYNTRRMQKEFQFQSTCL